MKKIFKRLARRRASERGFALPLSLGFGLVIILVATTMLIRTQDDQASASLQRASDSSLNVAEAGVTQVQTFINTYRLFARANSNTWTSANLQNAYTVSSNCNSILQDPDTFATAMAAQQWRSIGSPGINNGWYRLVSYTYNAATREATMIVDGAINPVNPGTNTNNLQTSISRLRVIVPIQEGTNGIPGLWLANGIERNGKNGGVEGTGGNDIQANALLNDCRIPLNSIDIVQPSPSPPSLSQPYSAQYTARQFPPLPTRPSNPNILSNITTATTLPRPGDRFVTRTVNGQTVRVYQYLATSDLEIRRDLTINPRATNLGLGSNERARVEFYLDRNLTTQTGNVDIIHTCANANCKATDFQIFGYGPTGSTICLKGNNYIDGFILAPNYTVGVAGSGAANNSTSGFRGAVWANQWSNGGGNPPCGSNTNNITVTQTANWEYGDLVSSDLVPVNPQPVKCWEKLDASQTAGVSCN